MPSISDKSKSLSNSVSPTSSTQPPGDPPSPPDDDWSKVSLPKEHRQEYLEQQRLQQLQERQSAMIAELDRQNNYVDREQQPIREHTQNKDFEGPER